MPRRAARARIAWEYRYEPPTLGRLLAAPPLSRESVALINLARKGVLAAANCEEAIVWFDDPWRWTLAYQRPHAQRPWVYIIPRPSGPQLALPLNRAHVAALPLRKLSRCIREGLASAPRVGETFWAQWPLTTRAQTEEILAIARRRWEEALATVA